MWISQPPEAAIIGGPDSPAAAEAARNRSGSQNRQRKRHVKIHLNEVEYEAITDQANRSGLSLSSLARAALLGADVPVTRRPPVEKALLAQALGQLGKIGSNLNQIAHRSNMGRDPMEGLMEAELSQLRLVRDAIMGALGRDY